MSECVCLIYKFSDAIPITNGKKQQPHMCQGQVWECTHTCRMNWNPSVALSLTPE